MHAEASDGKKGAVSPQSGVDLDVLRDKYRFERDRRLRQEGPAQYAVLQDDLGSYLDDPNADPNFTRGPLDSAVDTVIVGGGFAGLLAAARLTEKGLTDFTIIDSGQDFGGTWYWNRYPGCQCDVDAYCYLPLLEELDYVPREKYSYAPEIFEHSQRIGRAYGLYDKTLFRTTVTSLTWDDDAGRWIVATDRGDRIRARFVIQAAGVFGKAKFPRVDGLSTFGGHVFHTSRWDYAYTGGDHGGNLNRLLDKKVAIVGTGSTAIQCIPHLGAYADHLYVFQRTPSTVAWRENKVTDPAWAASLRPGWQRERRENFNDCAMGLPVREDLVDDGWTRALRRLRSGKFGGETPQQAERRRELEDAQLMETLRRRIDHQVKEPAIAEKLKPWYRYWCKRPTFHDHYLATFNRPNVTLVDTSEARGIQRITPGGIVANGLEYRVDCIIFATGFGMAKDQWLRAGYPVIGQQGLRLDAHFSKEVKTLHGFSVRGFPNLFQVGQSQNGYSVNFTAIFDDQARHLAYIIGEVIGRDIRYIHPTEAAQDEWVAEIRRLSPATAEFYRECTPGWYNREGQVHELGGGINPEGYGGGINAFNALMAEWRASGDLAGFEIVGGQ